MKWLGVFLHWWDAIASQGYPPALSLSVLIYTPGWRKPECECKVSCPWTQLLCNVPDQSSTQTAWSGGNTLIMRPLCLTNKARKNKNVLEESCDMCQITAITDWFAQITSYMFIHLQQQAMKARGYGMEVTADGSDFTDSPSPSQGSQLQCPNCRKYFPHDLLENHMRDCTGDDWIAYISRIMTRFWDCYGQRWSLDDASWQQISRTWRPVRSLFFSSFPAHVS